MKKPVIDDKDKGPLRCISQVGEPYNTEHRKGVVCEDERDD